MARKLEFLIDASCNKVILGKKEMSIPAPYSIHAYSGEGSSVRIELGLPAGADFEELHARAHSFTSAAQKAFPLRKTGIEVTYLSAASSGISMDREREHPYIEFSFPADTYSLRIELH